MSTHNLYEAQEVCDRIAILDRGKITALGTPAEIQYTIHEEKVFTITFSEAVLNEEREKKMLGALEALPGIHGVTPDINRERNLRSLSIRVDKNTDLSSILKVIVENGLKISSLNTAEPSLEDAFMAITRRRRE